MAVAELRQERQRVFSVLLLQSWQKELKIIHIVLTYDVGSRNDSDVFIVVTLVPIVMYNLEVHINHDVPRPFVHCYKKVT